MVAWRECIRIIAFMENMDSSTRIAATPTESIIDRKPKIVLDNNATQRISQKKNEKKMKEVQVPKATTTTMIDKIRKRNQQQTFYQIQFQSVALHGVNRN